MPFRRCAHPTCSALVREGACAWCPPHAAAQAAKTRRYEKQRARDPFRQFYQTRAWQVLRKTVLAVRPWCVDCGRPATDVDHLEPLREAPSRALDPMNVAPRCHRHHSARTARLHSWNRGR
jgi:5-methylcytosine-specific restriction enzyme A